MFDISTIKNRGMGMLRVKRIDKRQNNQGLYSQVDTHPKIFANKIMSLQKNLFWQDFFIKFSRNTNK